MGGLHGNSKQGVIDMVSLQDSKDMARAERFFLTPPDEWNDLDSLDEDNEMWLEADRQADERRLERCNGLFD